MSWCNRLIKLLLAVVDTCRSYISSISSGPGYEGLKANWEGMVVTPQCPVDVQRDYTGYNQRTGVRIRPKFMYI